MWFKKQVSEQTFPNDISKNCLLIPELNLIETEAGMLAMSCFFGIGKLSLNLFVHKMKYTENKQHLFLDGEKARIAVKISLDGKVSRELASSG